MPRKPGTQHPRATAHTHDRAQRAVLKACHICQNVTAHDAQCKATPAEGCRVVSCKLNHIETAATDWAAIKAAYRRPGEGIYSEESGDYFEAPLGSDPVHAREVLSIMERRAAAMAKAEATI